MIPNPCKAICKMDADTGLCIGCYRATFERGTNWFGMTEKRKEETMKLIAIRKKKFGELKADSGAF